MSERITRKDQGVVSQVHLIRKQLLTALHSWGIQSHKAEFLVIKYDLVYDFDISVKPKVCSYWFLYRNRLA